jgi:hypothetical protein
MMPASKKLYYTGIPVYIALLVLTALYYKERAFFLDNAYVIFNLLKGGHPGIYHFRFIQLFTESLPWLAMSMHAPLNAILLVYALSFWLFQLACYLLCGLWLRQYGMALVQLLVGILFISDNFYTSVSELPQAISVLCLLCACIISRRGQGGWLYYIICGLLLITMTFAHLLVCFPLAFVVLFFYLRKSEPVMPRRAVVALFLSYIIVIGFKTVFFREGYEHHSLGGLKHFVTLFPGYFSAYSFQRFFTWLGGRYIWITLLSSTIAAYYIARREWRYAGLFIASMAGYIVLTNVSYPDEKTNDFYIENLYYPLAVFIAIPFVFDILPVLLQRRQAMPVFLLVACTGIVRMWHTHTPYTARLQWQRGFMKAYAGEKLLVDVTQVPMDTLLMNWASPYEFALLSSSETPHTESLTIADTAAHLYWAAGERKQLVTQWGNIQYRDLPAQYFHFTDTVSGYKLLK